MRRIGMAWVLALGLVAGCVDRPAGHSPVTPLADDRSQPPAALFEHLLTAYLAEIPQAPAVCITLAPAPLAAGQLAALVARFPSIVPAAGCTPATPRVEVYDFACDSADSCTAWANAAGHPSTRWQVRWVDGSWRFAADLRRVAW